MRSVIGAYPSIAAARTAARTLELQISIQNIVILERRGRGTSPSDQREQAEYLLSMSGTAQSIEHARSLLRAQASLT